VIIFLEIEEALGTWVSKSWESLEIWNCFGFVFLWGKVGNIFFSLEGGKDIMVGVVKKLDSKDELEIY
jgi:hypothetical protein